MNSKLADAEQEIKALKKAKAVAELSMKERTVDQKQRVLKVRLLEEKIQQKDKQIAGFQSQLNELQNLVAKEKAARLNVEKQAAVRAHELEVQKAEAAKLVTQQEAKLQLALSQVEAAQAQVSQSPRPGSTSDGPTQSTCTESIGQRRPASCRSFEKVSTV